MPEQPDAKRKIDLEEFLQEFEAAMRAAGVEAPYAYDPETGLFGDEERGQVDVKQLFLQLGGGLKSQRAEALKKLATYYVERPQMPTDWGYVRPRLALTVLPRMGEELYSIQHRERPEPLPIARITEHLAFALGFPTALGSMNVTMNHLETWGVDPGAAFRAAAVNLEKRSNRPWVSSNEYAGVFASAFQDGFDACRLFFPRRFLAAPLRGGPVVVLASPHRLLFAGSDDEQGLVHLAKLARAFVAKREGTLFLRPMRIGDDGESWVDWLPPRTHPARAGLRWLQAAQEAHDVAQHGALVRLVAKGQPLSMSLPNLDVVEVGDGTDVYTRTVWDDEGPCALPKADRIAFRQAGRMLGTTPWATLVAKHPDLLEEAPGYPPRFIARGFPEEWQMKSIPLDPLDGPANG